MPVSHPPPRLVAALARRYAIEREIGRGGMATVYLAHDLRHDRRVALKVLDGEVAAALGPERFLREIAIAARLAHPHILPLYDSGQAAGLLYYAMPYVDGPTLRDRLRFAAPLPIDEVLTIVRELLDALGYAHAAGVIHRDVKPENVLLAGGHARLADFGVARAADLADAERLTDSGLAIGTAAYMSPEQAAGRGHVDARSDLYAVGCLLFELVATDPAREEMASDALAQRFSEPLPAVRSVRPAIPAWVDDVIARATAARSAERYPDAAAFAAALAGDAERGRRRRRIRRAVLAAAAAGSLVALGLLALRPAPLDPARVLVAGFQSRGGDSTLGALGDVASDYLARGLATTRLAHEVLDARVVAAEQGRALPATMAERRALARRLGAGTMIWGDISRAGDSLHIEAQLVDTRSGRVVLALDPVSGSAGSAERMAAVERLRQRVMGGFGAVLGTPNVEWQVYSVPPSYEAYREALAGEEAGWRFEFDEAQRHYARAAALDTTYVSAKTSGAFAAALQGDCRAADSIVTALAPVHPQLLAGDRAALDWAAATCDHDLEGSIRAGRALLAVAPRSAAMTVLTNIGLQHAGRMHEALAVLTGLDPERAGLHGAPLTIYQQFLLENLHYLGRYQEEFRRAESRLRQDSADAGVLIRRAVALGALGRIAEAERSTLGWEQRAGPHPTYFTPASMLTCTALEFREHGHPEAARRLLERAAAWYASHLPAGAAEETPNSCTSIFFDPRYYLARWDEARAIYERALGDSTNVLNLAALGALAVRRGDRETARRIDARLTRWDDGHAPAGSSAAETYGFRARLAALRGDRDSAVALFRRQNYRGPRLFHADPDLDSLRGYPPYEELVRLRD